MEGRFCKIVCRSAEIKITPSLIGDHNKAVGLAIDNEKDVINYACLDIWKLT